MDSLHTEAVEPLEYVYRRSRLLVYNIGFDF
jgi:hypothetical protein